MNDSTTYDEFEVRAKGRRAWITVSREDLERELDLALRVAARLFLLLEDGGSFADRAAAVWEQPGWEEPGR